MSGRNDEDRPSRDEDRPSHEDENRPRDEADGPEADGPNADGPDAPGREELDREVCVCFHVSLRKLVKFTRLEKPVVPTQLSECYGAGTGCGWCRPFLEHIFAETKAGRAPRFKMTDEEYRRLRKRYHREKGIVRE